MKHKTGISKLANDPKKFNFDFIANSCEIIYFYQAVI